MTPITASSTSKFKSTDCNFFNLTKFVPISIPNHNYCVCYTNHLIVQWCTDLQFSPCLIFTIHNTSIFEGLLGSGPQCPHLISLHHLTNMLQQGLMEEVTVEKRRGGREVVVVVLPWWSSCSTWNAGPVPLCCSGCSQGAKHNCTHTHTHTHTGMCISFAVFVGLFSIHHYFHRTITL